MHSSVIDSNVLRSEAEGQLSHRPLKEWGFRSNEELIHELRVHQEELEMQNEELRRTHLKLEQSCDRYIQLYDHSPVGFILLDRDGLISEANLTATNLFVVDRQHLMTCRFAGLVAPQDCDRWYLFFRTIINCVQCMTIELTLKSFDNREFPVQLSCVSIKSILHITIIDTTIIKQEEVIRTLRVMSLNVAQTSKTEKHQEKSLDFLRDVIKEDHRTMKTMHIDSLSQLKDISCSVPGVIYQFRLFSDGTSSFPYASSALFDIFRLSPAQVQHDASQWFALVHEDDLEDLLTSTQNSAKDLTLWQHDFRIKFDDGVERWVSGNSLPQLEYDGSVLWNGFMTDISERKQSDLDLEDSQMRWKFAVEGSGDGLWDYNIKTNKMLYASCWNKMLGYTEKEGFAAKLNWFPLIHSEDKLSFNTAKDAYLNGNSDNFQTEYRLQCKDDSYKWILARGIVISSSEDGSPLRMIGTHSDITARKYQEQQNKEHLDQLAHVTLLGLMGEMASGLAHEVNQPLSAITTYSQVIVNLTKSANMDVVKLAEIAGKTKQQALRAGEIIHRMKDFCKSKAQKRSDVDINNLVYDCVNLCNDVVKQNNINVLLELENDLPQINVDHIQIEQVLINLLRNGIDAINSNPEKRQGKIIIQSKLTDNHEIQIRVKDNGTGIDKVQQEKVLMPFHTTKQDGMGMGLSISRSLIEAHKGTLYFNSAFGKGSTFYFTLPI